MMTRYLNFSGDFTEKIIKGEKRATLRLGVKDYREGEIVIIRAGDREIGMAKITKVRRVRLSELSDEDLRMDGYTDKEYLLRDLKKFYGYISEDAIFTQIVFKLLS